MKQLFLSILWLLPNILIAQNLNYDIYLIDIKKQEVGGLTFEKAVNISNHPGYDNQPSFTLDGKKVLYTAMTKDSTTDIYHYSFKKKKSSNFKSLPKTSEYSPTENEHSKILTVRVEEDGKTQRIWQSDNNGLNDKLYLDKVDSVGYFCLIPDTNILFAFILSNDGNEGHQLRMINTSTQEEILIDDQIGRCIRMTLDSSSVFYVRKMNDTTNLLRRYNFYQNRIYDVLETVDGAEDFLFYDNTRIWMAKDNKLYEYWIAAKFRHWSEIKAFNDTNSHLKNITRMNLSPDKSRLVLVAED